LRREDDYIGKPKDDGYRSRHLIFGFCGRDISNYDGKRIELQVRTRLQHSWATAVEAVGLFRGEELKNHQGSDDWLRLFVLLSGEFAVAERCPVPLGCPDQYERRREIRELAKSLDAVKALETINHGVRGTDLPLSRGYHPTHYLIRYDHATNAARQSA
jgi:ppGpp synthetase/RelA/SpoT-type nucleotidyltranferase